ncbi:MAG: M1 family metallopeptidase [Cyclobacteriaceae bacterium]
MNSHKTVTCWLILVTLLPTWLYGQRRASEPFDVLHYNFSIGLTDESDIIKGEAEIQFQLPHTDVDTLTLDLVAQIKEGKGMKVVSVNIWTDPVNFSQEEETLKIFGNLNPVQKDTLSLKIAYMGAPQDGLIISESKFGRRTFFSDHWPNRVHHWLPVVDHPSDKATCEFRVTAPSLYSVVGNGTLLEESNLGDGSKFTHWKQNQPIPTKVMAMGVANFSIQYTGDVKGVPVSSWVFPENRTEGFYDYAVGKDILQYFTRMLGDYPFDKLAHIQSKTKWGGMENASAIFYTEKSVTGNRKYEKTIAHETAHQWFGNYVTESDWKDIWLSEGFATYLTHLYTESKYGREQMEHDMKVDTEKIKRFITKYPNSSVVENESTNLNYLINANSYQKASWILHMLRHETGDDAFFEILHVYLKKFPYANASSKDFVEIVNHVTGNKYGWFFDQWLKRPGIPQVNFSWAYDKNKVNLVFTQADGPYMLPLDIQLEYEDGEIKKLKSGISEKTETITIKSKDLPSAITIDPDCWLLAEVNEE